jgi:non-ribosomal peptide synthetase component E (peptide arylation enzyme)
MSAKRYQPGEPYAYPLIIKKLLTQPLAAAADRGVLPKYGVPDKYVVVAEIPKTSVGKIDKKKIRETYA